MKNPVKPPIKSDDRRQHPRVDAQIEVSFPTSEAYTVEYTKNISKGGIFVKTAKLPDPNAVVELKMRFPGAKEIVPILARVARTVAVSDPDHTGEHLYGVGFYFIEWSMRAKQVFEDFYKKAQNSDDTDEGDAADKTKKPKSKPAKKSS